MSTVHIPKTIDAAKASLGGLDSLLRAKQWERAAIVYAFTESRPGARTDLVGNPTRLTIKAFAALGITGLSHHETVSDYRKAWELAMEKGSPDVKPGDTIPIPDMTWPPGQTSRRGSHGTETEAREYIARNPQVAVDAIKAVPAVAEAVTTAIVHDNELANTVARKSFAKSIGARDTGKFATPTIIPTYEREKELSKAITVVSKAIDDEESGAHKFDAGSTAQLTLLFLKLKARADRIVAAQPAVHGEIDAFLKSAKE